MMKYLITLFLIVTLRANAQTYIQGVALIQTPSSIATSGGTTTLTKDSETNQQFTGSSTQTVVLPDATTLQKGRSFYITNRSTGTITVNFNGGALARSLPTGTQSLFIVENNVTSAGVWDSSIGSELLSIGLIDSQAPSSNGAAASNNLLYLQSASATNPGLVNNTTQSFSGNKTFTGSISAANLTGTNSGDVTIGTANGLSIAGQVLSLGLSSTSTTGALSSTDWNTFNNKQPAGNYAVTALNNLVSTSINQTLNFNNSVSAGLSQSDPAATNPGANLTIQAQSGAGIDQNSGGITLNAGQTTGGPPGGPNFSAGAGSLVFNSSPGTIANAGTANKNPLIPYFEVVPDIVNGSWIYMGNVNNGPYVILKNFFQNANPADTAAYSLDAVYEEHSPSDNGNIALFGQNNTSIQGGSIILRGGDSSSSERGDIVMLGRVASFPSLAADPVVTPLNVGSVYYNTTTNVLRQYIGASPAWTNFGGTVTSVALSLPSIFNVSGSPVTSTGTLTGTLANESANTVFAGPGSGAATGPTFRSLNYADITSAVTAPTGVVTFVTAGTGTYTVPTPAPAYLEVEVIGAGGGGAGSPDGGGSPGGSGTNGGTSSFGATTSLIQAAGGSGATNSSSGFGGTGGSPSFGAAVIPVFSQIGSTGNGASGVAMATGGMGGGSCHGGGGPAAPPNAGPVDAVANSGGGGSGGAPSASVGASGGGGGGACARGYIIAPTAAGTFQVTVGAAGTAGGGGGGGFSASNGSLGKVIVIPHYQ